MTNQLWQWDAVDLAPAIARGEVSSVEVVRSVVDRMRAENPRLNAVVRDFGDQALLDAARADAATSGSESLGALHGIPVTVKINVDVEGQPTDNGMPFLKDLVAPGDSAVVENLRNAGAVIVGRTNAPELSMRITTDNPLHGRTFNPWDRETSPGGSSGGAGVAAAAGFGPIHHGNDIGGSLRLPAMASGVVSLKPTQGRIPSFSPSATAERALLSVLMSTQGAIARSVADVALATRVMSAGSANDPWWVPAPWDGPPMSLPIKVAVTRNGHGTVVHPEVLELVDRAAAILSDAGYDVVEIEPPPIVEAVRGWFSVGSTEMALTLDPLVRQHGSADLKTAFDTMYTYGQTLDLAGYRAGLSDRTRMIREWSVFLAAHPLVLTPYLLQPTHRWNADVSGEAAAHELLDGFVYSTGLNFLGLPAGVVPVGYAGGLPSGVQLVGSRFREDLVIEAMATIEAVVGRLTPTLWARMAA